MLTWFDYSQAPRGSGGVMVYGRVKNTCGCGTWGHGLVVNMAVLC